MQIDPKTLRGNWNYPTAVRFGPGRIAELADAAKALGMARPLVVTDPGLAKLPMVAKAVDSLKAAGLGAAVFSEIRPNPVGANVTAGVAMLKAGKHDGVVAFGGGSALDVGKAVALMAGQTRPIWDFEDVGDNWKRVDEAGVLPSIAVPTTAGTGSEVGRVSVIADESRKAKVLIFHLKVQPRIVISDPELTLGLPAKITAATGMDALAHCLEAYCAPGFHPMADGVALEGMRLIKTWLPVATRTGSDLAARAYMLAAATMGATAFQKGLGAVHSLSHPVGARFDAHHGLTNAVFMPYVLAFNRPSIEERMAHLARVLDLKSASFGAVMDWVLALRQELGVPHTTKDLGVDMAQADAIAREAEADPSTPSNPRPFTAKDARAVLAASYEGRV